MKVNTYLLAVFSAILVLISRTGSCDGISYAATRAAGIPIKVITIDLNEPAVKVTAQMAAHGSGSTEDFHSMIKRSHPSVAITGTFFSLRSLKPSGDICIDGRMAHFGGFGTAMCLTENNQVEYIKPKPTERVDWGQYDFVLRCGPRLLSSGSIPPDLMHEEFCTRYLIGRHPRIAIGTTKDNRMMVVVTRDHVYLSRLARAMKSLGVVDAINLDGGDSIGVYYRGKTIITPRRRLTNLVVAYDDRARYDKYKDQLLPVWLRGMAKRQEAALAAAVPNVSASPAGSNATESSVSGVNGGGLEPAKMR